MSHYSFFPDFEQAIERSLGDRIRNSDQDAIAFWCAMANIQWSHIDHEVWDGWSFRSAGMLIERMRGDDDSGFTRMDYMKWYCCGRDGVVSPWIAEALKREGWIWRNYPKVVKH
jgi:hypothetical protein